MMFPQSAYTVLGAVRSEEAIQRLRVLIGYQVATNRHPAVFHLAARSRNAELVGLSASEEHDLVIVAVAALADWLEVREPEVAAQAAADYATALMQQEGRRHG